MFQSIKNAFRAATAEIGKWPQPLKGALAGAVGGLAMDAIGLTAAYMASYKEPVRIDGLFALIVGGAAAGAIFSDVVRDLYLIAKNGDIRHLAPKP